MTDRSRPTASMLSGLYGAERRAPAGLLEFLWDRGDLWPAEAALCLTAWLTQDRTHPVVTPRELSALTHDPAVRALVPRLKSFADALRSCADGGLMEPVPGPPGAADAAWADRAGARAARGPWYRLTPLGRVVAAALPDRRAVATLRGLRSPTRSGIPGPVRRVLPAH